MERDRSRGAVPAGDARGGPRAAAAVRGVGVGGARRGGLHHEAGPAAGRRGPAALCGRRGPEVHRRRRGATPGVDAARAGAVAAVGAALCAPRVFLEAWTVL